MEKKSISISTGRAGAWIEPGSSRSDGSTLGTSFTSSQTLSSTPRVSAPPKTILFGGEDPSEKLRPLGLFDIPIHQTEVTEQPRMVDSLLFIPKSTVPYISSILKPITATAATAATAAEAPAPSSLTPENVKTLDTCFADYITAQEAAMKRRIDEFVQQEQAAFESLKKDVARAHQEMMAALQPLADGASSTTNTAGTISTTTTTTASAPVTPSVSSSAMSSPATVVADRSGSASAGGFSSATTLKPPKLVLPTSSSLLGGKSKGKLGGSAGAPPSLAMGDSALFQFEEADDDLLNQEEDGGLEDEQGSGNEDGGNGATEEDNVGNTDRGEVVLATSVPISIPMLSTTPSAASLRRDTMNRDQRERIQRQTSLEGQQTNMAASIQSLSRMNMADQDSFQPNSPSS